MTGYASAQLARALLVIAVIVATALLVVLAIGARVLWQRGTLLRAQAREVQVHLPRPQNRAQRRAQQRQGQR